jgi:hypothetical protein
MASMPVEDEDLSVREGRVKADAHLVFESCRAIVVGVEFPSPPLPLRDEVEEPVGPEVTRDVLVMADRVFVMKPPIGFLIVRVLVLVAGGEHREPERLWWIPLKPPRRTSSPHHSKRGKPVSLKQPVRVLTGRTSRNVSPWRFVRRVRTAALALAIVAATGSAPLTSQSSAAGTASGNAVTDWSLIAQNAIVAGRPPGSSLVLEGIVQVAIYDATVTIEGGYEPFIVSPTVPRPASTAAAVAAAARGVFVARVPGQADLVQAQYEAYLSSIPDGPAKANGISVGEDVAEAILAWRAGDGFDNVVPMSSRRPGRASSSRCFPPPRSTSS